MSLIYEFHGSASREIANAGYIKACWIEKKYNAENVLWFVLIYVLSPNDFKSFVWFDTEKKANLAMDDLKALMIQAEKGML